MVLHSILRREFSVRERYVGIIVLAAALLVAYTLIFKFPTFAAVACPSCYGLERVQPKLFVDREMGKAARLSLLTELQASRSRLSAIYGAPRTDPVFAVCSTEACNHKLGGRGALAVTYNTPFFAIVRVAPKGMSRIIITHELSHVELHKRIGGLKVFVGAFPAWFDEGVAAYVSDDPRYLNPGPDAAARCRADTTAPLPRSSISWIGATRHSMQIYQHAACKTIKWMDANGGQPGLLAMLDRVGKGQKGP